MWAGYAVSQDARPGEEDEGEEPASRPARKAVAVDAAPPAATELALLTDDEEVVVEDEDKESLVAQVQELQRGDDGAAKRKWRRYCEDAGAAGCFDPSGHNEEFLRGFFRAWEAGDLRDRRRPRGSTPKDPARHAELVEWVKALERRSPEGKKRWYKFCKKSSGASKCFDPLAYDEDFLAAFMDSLPPEGSLLDTEDPEKAELTSRIKNLQRSSPEQWWDFVKMRTGSTQFDPGHYDVELLREFCELAGLRDPLPAITAGTGSGKAGGAEGEGEGGRGVAEKVYVGGLPKVTTEEEVLSHFSDYGTVVDVSMKYDSNGLFRGFAFVTFDSIEAAKALVDNYEHHKFQGKWIDIKAAKPDLTSNGVANGGKADEAEVKEKLFLGRLPRHTNEDAVRRHFEQFGIVTDVQLKHTPNGEFKGYGFITFDSVETAAFVLDNEVCTLYEGSRIVCSVPLPKDSKGGKGGKGFGMMTSGWHAGWDSAWENGDSWGFMHGWGQPATDKGLGKTADKGGYHRSAARAPIEPTEQIFVGGLPKSATEHDVRTHFSEFGAVTSVELKYDNNYLFRGFGFVTFDCVASAVRVLENYANNRFEGKWIECKAADASREVALFVGRRGGSVKNAGSPPAGFVLRLRGLPEGAQRKDVMKIFREFSLARILIGEAGTGFVEFASETDCSRAFRTKQGATVGNQYIELSWGTRQEMDAVESAASVACGVRVGYGPATDRGGVSAATRDGPYGF